MNKKHAAVELPPTSAGTCRTVGRAFWASIWFVAVLVWGCADRGPENKTEVLIQVNDSKITVAEFNHRFEVMRDDMPSQVVIKPAEQLKMRRHLLNQLIERLILLERAKELGLRVSDVELKTAVDAVKNDYPGDAFQQVLLEQNVSLRQWERELKTRLLLEKVINKELEPGISIQPEDIAAYYEKHYHSEAAGEAPLDEDFNATLLRLVKKQKQEEAYRSWIAGLQRRYSVHLNAEAWQELNISNL
jgi:hypothetical protein